MFRAVAVLGDDSVPVIEKICRDIRSVGGDTVKRVVDIGLELAVFQFLQIVSRNEERAIEKRAFAVERRHSGQTDVDVLAQPGAATVGEEVGV